MVALDKATGKEVWRALTSEEVGYSPPVIHETGGKRQLIVWLSDSVNGLDPATGRTYWSVPYPASGQPRRPAVTIHTVRRLGDLLFLSTYYHGPMVLRLTAERPGATVVWHGKSDNPARPDGVHTLMATPIVKGGYVYGVCALGQLRCLDIATGKERWHTLAATGGKKGDCATVFLVRLGAGDRAVLFNDQGDLILADLTPAGYREVSRAHILDPLQEAMGRVVVWSHPAFAHGCVFARNDREMVCLSLRAAPG